MEQIYLTTEQIQRLAALSLDALAGIQMESNANADSPVTGCYVSVDNPSLLVFFEIDSDGKLVSLSS